MTTTATTIKVERTTKAKLDRLQALLTLALGKKVGQERVVRELLRLAEAHRDELFENDRQPRLTPAQWRKVKALISDWGIVVGDIDEAVYGT